MSCDTSSSVSPSRARSSAEQLEDLRAHRHVEGGQRLVADEHARPVRQGAGERDALALAARELVREAVGHGCLEPDVLEHLAHPRPAVAGDVERPQRLADDASDAHPRVERRVRVLEHDAGLATQPVQCAGARRRHPPGARRTSTVPSVGVSSASSSRTSVDLPEPDSPMMPTASPSATSMSAPFERGREPLLLEQGVLRHRIPAGEAAPLDERAHAAPPGARGSPSRRAAGPA